MEKERWEVYSASTEFQSYWMIPWSHCIDYHKAMFWVRIQRFVAHTFCFE